MKKTILLLAALCITLSTWAYDFTSGGIYYTITSSTSPYTVSVSTNGLNSSSGSYSGALTIPSSVIYNSKTYTVTSIQHTAFGSCQSLTSLSIPATVDSLSGLDGCFDLTSITIDTNNPYLCFDNGVVFNKNKTKLFACCPANAGAYIVPSTVTSIFDGAFSQCYYLTSINIPTSVTSIGDGAFGACVSLSTITIPNSVTYLGEGAFALCLGLTSISLSSSINTLKESVIYNCPELTSITIPASVTSIAGNFINYCNKLNSIIVDNSNTQYSSSNGVLFNKDKTILIRCPEGKTGTYVIPSTVTTIGENAFNNCNDLTSVTIPSSVTAIGQVAFNYSGLTSIYVNLTTPLDLGAVESIFDGVFFGVNTSTCVLHVPVGSKSLYMAADQWKDFTNIVDDITLGVFNAKASNLKITTENGKALISGLSQGTSLAVYNLQGIAVYNQQATSETVPVNLPARGVYVVKVGAESVKVVY